MDYFLSEGLRAFQATNNTLPDRIIFYRDGVSDGELEQLKSVEIEKIKEAFNEIGQGYEYVLQFTIYCTLSYVQYTGFALTHMFMYCT